MSLVGDIVRLCIDVGREVRDAVLHEGNCDARIDDAWPCNCRRSAPTGIVIVRNANVPTRAEFWTGVMWTRQHRDAFRFAHAHDGVDALLNGEAWFQEDGSLSLVENWGRTDEHFIVRADPHP